MEATLHSSCLCAHHSRNHRALWQPLPLLPPTPITVSKARVKTRGKEKARTISPVALTTTAMTTAGVPVLQYLDRHNLDVGTDASFGAIAGVSTTMRRVRCTDVLRGSRRFLLRAHAGSSTAPAARRGSCLVVLDGHVGSAIIGQFLQHHGLDSPRRSPTESQTPTPPTTPPRMSIP
jgi:hypothetical protein